VRDVESAEAGSLPAIGGEARVQRAVGVVAGKPEVLAGCAATGEADRHDPAVRLDRHVASRVAGPEQEVGRLPTVPGEARVERAIDVVAGKSEVIPGAADRDDLPALERHPPRQVELPEVGRLRAVAGEARIEQAVGVVAGELEVASAAADRDDPAVALDRHPVCHAPEAGRLLAVAGEVRVERPVEVVTGERETGAGGADRDDPAVRLDVHPVGLVTAPDTEVSRLLAVPGEARLERSVRVVAGERERAEASFLVAGTAD